MKILFLTKNNDMCDMMYVNLKKAIEYLKILESLRSENLTEYHLCTVTEYLYIFSLPRKVSCKHKQNH